VVGGGGEHRRPGGGVRNAGATVDGFDFFAVHEAAGEAIERAARAAAVLIEVKFMRYYGHFEGDGQTYRGENEVARIKEEKDVLKQFREKVTTQMGISGDELDLIDKEVGQLIDQAVEAAQAAPLPGADDLLTDVYVSY
jgi:Pyruvate/2-oxoglutarate dehydrogenase complex, dehydrogenase (E1) component, eukaryotic type, alpha subunit